MELIAHVRVIRLSEYNTRTGWLVDLPKRVKRASGYTLFTKIKV